MNLSEYGLCYVATAYSKHVGGLNAAYRDACTITADLVRIGVKAFSPISHGHGISMHGNIDPLDHAFWLEFDEAMMEKADTLIVAMMDGWRDSKGIGIEIDAFTKAGKPVLYLDPETLECGEEPWATQAF